MDSINFVANAVFSTTLHRHIATAVAWANRKGRAPYRGSVACSGLNRTSAYRGINLHKLFDTKRLLLSASEQGKIQFPRGRFYGQFDRLALPDDRLADLRRENPERNKPTHRAVVDSFPSGEFANRRQQDSSSAIDAASHVGGSIFPASAINL
jgi:hypothetical protein